ncbi:hypothetical protein [Streptomyces sp. NPDC058657]|uniref:hypothetical protein n=1 Tax=unclassified Streptomyces TaxID=2593676 RepID=UPI003660E510
MEKSNTRVFVDAGRSECASADSDGQFASLEVPEEGIPFFVGGGSVLLAGPERSAPGDECAMGFDGLAGVDGVVSHGRVDAGVPGDDLRDVRGKAAADGVDHGRASARRRAR